MLIGEYKHSIDAKKRMAIPAKFRKELGKKAVITIGLDKCLVVYPLSEWQKLAEKLNALPMGQSDARRFARLMFGEASEVEIDSLGRILIPETLKNYAGLKNKVIITGVYNRLEIWNEESWQAYKNRLEKETDVLAEKLGEIGAF